MQFPAWKQIVVSIFLIGLGLSGCGGKGDIDPNASGIPPPTSPAAVVVISNVTAQPQPVLPGQSTILMLTADDGAGGTLSYHWRATDGTFGATDVNPATWTAPATEGGYLIQVDVSNGATTARGYISVAVSAAPTLPVITSVLPGEAGTGSEVRILGSGFGGTRGSSVVMLGGVSATNFQGWSDTEIRVRIPDTSVTGDVTVTVNGVTSPPAHLVVLWDNKTPQNAPVTQASDTQSGPRLVSDGSGGAIVAWVDYRNGNADIYAQRLDSRGRPMWTSNGVVVTLASGNQVAPQLVSDGTGGAIIVWQDFRNGAQSDIYAQRVNPDGLSQWAAGGIVLSDAADIQQSPRVVTDAAGGAIVVWEDRRNGSDYDLYAQRVDAAGTVQWAANGVPVIAAAGNQFNPQVIAESGGAMIGWEDYRNGSHYDLYAQQLDANGTMQWSAAGVVVSDAIGNQLGLRLIVDGSGGLVAVWQDYRNGSDYDLYAQRLNASGVQQWPVNGVVVSNAANNQAAPSIVSGGADAYIVAWEDYRNGNADVYAQRINSVGTVLWTVNGVAVSTAVGGQTRPQAVADDADGAIIVWEDYREGSVADIYAQRINDNGEPLWLGDGLAVSRAQDDQLSPQTIADGSGGAITVWEDHRNTSIDIYAQGVSAGGKP